MDVIDTSMMDIILVDADGVLLDWERSFDEFMVKKGKDIVPGGLLSYSMKERYGLEDGEDTKYIDEFVHSSMIGYLRPHRDAVKYVKKLSEEGYDFVCISSLSRDKYAQLARIDNLTELFGKGVFSDFMFLNTGEEKNKVLKEFEGSYHFWVEDKVENAIAGQDLGLQSLLMEHPHHVRLFSETPNHPAASIPRFKTWKEVYSHVTGAY